MQVKAVPAVNVGHPKVRLKNLTTGDCLKHYAGTICLNVHAFCRTKKVSARLGDI